MSVKTTRVLCEACLLPHATCVCAAVETAFASLQPIILQHPTETTHTKNTARLIKLVVTNAKHFVGESSQDFTEAQSHIMGQRTLLLYPSTENTSTLLLIQECSGCLQHSSLKTPDNLSSKIEHSINHQLKCSERCAIDLDYRRKLSQYDCVILLDASWRKAKKMFYRNHWLQQLPRCEIQLSQASNYVIRKHSASHSLSTIETLMLLYKILRDPCYTNLNDIFNYFKQRKLAVMPREIRERYLS